MKIIIAGGGTGGHLFPGIAIAEEFMKRECSSHILFVGTKKGIESTIVPKEGFALKTIVVGGVVGKGILVKICAAGRIPLSILQSFFILLSYRPDIVVGVGGYASFPPVFSSCLLRIPSLLHEQNRVPGLANKVLARLVRMIAITFEESAGYFPKGKTSVTGNPVRKGLINRLKKEKTKGALFTIFVFGGSQGAASINSSMIESLEHLSTVSHDIHIIHQTGKDDVVRVRSAYDDKGVSAEVFSFISHMDECYARADLVICRAGATTIAELAACGKPSILIPYPFAAHKHQEMNAKAVQEKGAAYMLLDNEMNGKTLAHTIHSFFSDRERVRIMADRSREMGRVDAAEKIVDMCYSMMGNQNNV